MKPERARPARPAHERGAAINCASSKAGKAACVEERTVREWGGERVGNQKRQGLA